MRLSMECSGCKAICISIPKPTTEASAKEEKPKKQTVPATQNCADTSSKKKTRPSLCDYLRQEEEEEEKIAAQLSSTTLSVENKSKSMLKKINEKPAEAAVAVVEQSSDPYGDFRRSMVEMIMARKKLSDGDLNRLLKCYLSLNPPQHHPVILEAFCDLFRGCPVQYSNRW